MILDEFYNRSKFVLVFEKSDGRCYFVMHDLVTTLVKAYHFGIIDLKQLENNFCCLKINYLIVRQRMNKKTCLFEIHDLSEINDFKTNNDGVVVK